MVEEVANPLTGVMTQSECLAKLRCDDVARLGFVVDGRPVVLPFSYRLVERAAGLPEVVVSLSAHAEVARADAAVCLELDEIDRDARRAWSVVAAGRMRRLFPGEALPVPVPRTAGDQLEIRVIELTELTGRRFVTVDRPSPVYSVEWQVG